MATADSKIIAAIIIPTTCIFFALIGVIGIAAHKKHTRYAEQIASTSRSTGSSKVAEEVSPPIKMRRYRVLTDAEANFYSSVSVDPDCQMANVVKCESDPGWIYKKTGDYLSLSSDECLLLAKKNCPIIGGEGE